MHSTTQKIQKILPEGRPNSKKRVWDVEVLKGEGLFSLFESAMNSGDSSYHLPSLIHAPEMAVVVFEIKEALKRGILPKRNGKGCSESYIFYDCDHRKIAIFKPHFSYFNYFSHFNEAQREVAAYRLDHEHFASVPATVFSTFGKRVGSLQAFIDAPQVSEISREEQILFSPSQMRRIAILDIRMLNFDRQTTNILYLSDEILGQLVPIDHGSSLTYMDPPSNFLWIKGQAAKLPFSPYEQEYIAKIDPIADARLLIEEIGIEKSKALICFLATLFLKEGAKREFCVEQINKMVFRHKMDPARKKRWLPSLLEKVYNILEERIFTDWPSFHKEALEQVGRIVDHEIG